ncbi:MAG TPA: hypothetical protein VJT84_14775 [Gaiellaceae bacterium]|nr:hypothetical protein [Gaiellaceae bacterium]
MRRCALWLVTLPIALAGIELGHAIANATFGSPEGAKELFASPSTGSGLAPLLGLFAVGLVVIGLACRFAPRWWFPRQARAVALPFVLLPPIAFALLELSEAALHRGTIPWGEAVQPTFLFGLALQFPLALVGYALARLLLRASDRVRRFFARSDRTRLLPLPALPLPRSADRALRGTRRGSPRLGRAPPALLAASR